MKLEVLARSKNLSDYITLDVPDDSPASIMDAINQFFQLKATSGDPADKKYGLYERIVFQYNGKSINLTNPARTNHIAVPWGDDKPSVEFCKAWSKGRKQPEKPPEQDDGKKDEKPSDPSLPYLSDPNWYPNDPTKVFGTHFVGTPDLTSWQWSQVDPTTHLDATKDWQVRWDNVMELSKTIAKKDHEISIERARAFNAISTEYANAVTEGSKGVFNWPQAIFRILANAIKSGFTMLSWLPQDLQMAGQRMSMNLTIIYLSLERLFTIATGLYDLAMKMYQYTAALDWEGAIKIANKLIADEKTSLDKAKELGLLDEDYNPQGFEHWQVPIAPVNSDEEFSQYEALSALAHSPLFGAHLQAQMQMQLAKDYQLATGVGFPNSNAWYKFILNNQIGTTVPIQEATDMAGQVPDWFIARTTDYKKHIAPVIHQQQHEETKHMKK